jgi:3-isopropylmalate dehydratase small subunit
MRMMGIRGCAWLFEDDVNTDVIHPPDFFSLDPDRVKRGLFHGLDPTIQPRLQPGDVLVAGRNFGCGSSRETCVRSLVLNRIGAVLAVSFARIFFRSATNHGLPCLTFRDPAHRVRIRPGERLEISVSTWTVLTEDLFEIQLEPVGPFVRRIWEAGGLLSLVPS